VREYGLEIYVSDPQRVDDAYTHVYQYLVVHTDHRRGALYGQVLDRHDKVQGMTTNPGCQCALEQGNGETKPVRGKLIHKDSAPAKDRQLQVWNQPTRPTQQPSIPPWSVNEDQLRLEKQR